VNKIITIILLILIPAVCLGADNRSDRPHWSLELKGGTFFPASSQWSKFYGTSYMGEYGASFSYKVLRQLEVGLEGTYTRGTGHGQVHGPAGSVIPTGRVTYQQVPLNLFVLGRAVFDENQWLVPYAGGGYTRMFFRQEISGQGKKDGSVNGFHLRAGVQLLLDRLEEGTAREAYQEFGLFHTYLFVEGRYTRAVADTATGGSVNIGGPSCLGGFLFEF
jgi:opacity protein-like surface antigen